MAEFGDAKMDDSEQFIAQRLDAMAEDLQPLALEQVAILDHQAESLRTKASGIGRAIENKVLALEAKARTDGQPNNIEALGSLAVAMVYLQPARRFHAWWLDRKAAKLEGEAQTIRGQVG